MPGCCCCMPLLHNNLMDLWDYVRKNTLLAAKGGCICTPLTPPESATGWIWSGLQHSNMHSWVWHIDSCDLISKLYTEISTESKCYIKLLVHIRRILTCECWHTCDNVQLSIHTSNVMVYKNCNLSKTESVTWGYCILIYLISECSVKFQVWEASCRHISQYQISLATQFWELYILTT